MVDQFGNSLYHGAFPQLLMGVIWIFSALYYKSLLIPLTAHIFMNALIILLTKNIIANVVLISSLLLFTILVISGISIYKKYVKVSDVILS